MYFEEAEVKEYHRKNKEGKKTPYYQIRLKKDSKFSAVKEVALVDISEIKTIDKEYDVNKIFEMKAKLNETSTELTNLKKELNEYKTINKNLKKDNYNLQDKLIKCNEKKDEKTEEKDKKTEELLKEKDLVKEEQNIIINLLNVIKDYKDLNLLDRIRNKEPESSKYLNKSNIPEKYIDVQNE